MENNLTNINNFIKCIDQFLYFIDSIITNFINSFNKKNNIVSVCNDTEIINDNCEDNKNNFFIKIDEYYI